MKGWVVLLVIMLASISLSIADNTAFTNTQVAGAGATVMYKNVDTSIISTGESFNGNYEKQSMIALGYSTLDVNDSTYAENFNAADYSMDAEFSDAALMYESHAMEQQVLGLSDPMMASISDITPSYQYASAGATQSGSAGGRYTSDAIINNANITVSARAEGNLGGVEFKKYATAKRSFSADSSSGINFEKEQRMTYASYGGGNKPYEGALDFTWKDHSNAIKAVNTTPEIISNETVEGGNVSADEIGN